MTTPKIYIATRLEKHALHNEIRDKLAPYGIELTYDWTIHGSVKDTTKERITEVCSAELAGVRDADMVIALLPGGRGTHAEIGAAAVLGKPLALYSDNPRHFIPCKDTCAFYWPPDVFHTTSMDRLLAYVAGNGHIDCRACRHCGLYPKDNDFICGHPRAGEMGTFIQHLRKPDSFCTAAAEQFKQHPGRHSNGNLKSS